MKIVCPTCLGLFNPETNVSCPMCREYDEGIIFSDSDFGASAANIARCNPEDDNYLDTLIES